MHWATSWPRAEKLVENLLLRNQLRFFDVVEAA
jgi:hypothetical protein